MRKLGLTTSLCVALIFAITNVSSSTAQISYDTIKIGVMADMNGPLSTAGGRGSVEAARMAAEEFGGLIAGKHIEIVSADHQNKPDIGAALPASGSTSSMSMSSPTWRIRPSASRS